MRLYPEIADSSMALFRYLAAFDKYQTRFPFGEFPVPFQRKIGWIASFIGIAALHGVVHDAVRRCFCVQPDRLRHIQLIHCETSSGLTHMGLDHAR